MTVKVDADTQRQVDRAWYLYNNILEELHQLDDLIEELMGEVDFPFGKVQMVVGDVQSLMDEANSTGQSILPPHTSDKED